jgi:hypothetical protein
MFFRLSIVLFFIQFQSFAREVLLPFDAIDRTSFAELHLTEIGDFGLMRKARPKVAAHYHTGIDIMRPGDNYKNNPIFPIAERNVISKRIDGPFAQLIVEHQIDGITFWTVYEHIAGIKVEVNDIVNAEMPIARFMNKAELNQYGWQFDHFHLEILKTPPNKLKPNPKTPDRHYNSHTLICFTEEELHRYFYNPIEFLRMYR